MANDAKPGAITWTDLTVDDASQLRDFYRVVVGWDVVDTDMGGYNDFTVMQSGEGEPVAGICHARGANAGLPSQWLIYVTVADLDASMERCSDGGGSIVFGPKPLSGGRFCVIEDPAGAVMALFQP